MPEGMVAAASWGKCSLAPPPGDGGATEWCWQRKGIGSEEAGHWGAAGSGDW
jgi:hypothetical protein